MMCPMCNSDDYVKILVAKPSIDVRNGIDRTDRRRKYIYRCNTCKYGEEDVAASDTLDNSDLDSGPGFEKTEWEPE